MVSLHRKQNFYISFPPASEQVIKLRFNTPRRVDFNADCTQIKLVFHFLGKVRFDLGKNIVSTSFLDFIKQRNITSGLFQSDVMIDICIFESDFHNTDSFPSKNTF